MSALPFTNGFYVSDSLPLSHQSCTNFYVAMLQVHQGGKEYLLGTPGITELSTTGAIQQVNRGSKKKNKIPYFVNGNSLYNLIRTVDTYGVETFTYNELGTIEGTGRVSMAHNGIQLMILVPGGKGYIYNEDDATPFQEITATGFTANGTPQHCTFIDGYFSVTLDSKKWQTSALNDGLSWASSDVGTAESNPDAIVALVVYNNQMMILGAITCEGFQNVGGSGFAFQRNNVFLDKGCTSPFSVVRANKTFYMIGAGEDETPAIWAFNGNDFDKISTTPIDTMLSRCSDEEIESAFAWTYAKRGAYFLGFNFADKTLVYEILTSKWHERTSRIDEETSRWRVNALLSVYGRTLVFDKEDGRIGVLDFDAYTEYGNSIIREFATQPFFAEEDGITIPRIELLMESGIGDELTENPVVSMALSKDGKVFSADRNRSIGKIGAFEQRIVWRKNGRFPRMTVLKFLLTDPIKPVVTGLYAK